MAETMKLTSRLDLTAAQNLAGDLIALKADGEVVLDACDVTHLGALCAQAILAAATRNNAAGGTLKLENVSKRVEEQLGYMGLSSEKLMEGVV